MGKGYEAIIGIVIVLAVIIGGLYLLKPHNTQYNTSTTIYSTTVPTSYTTTSTIQYSPSISADWAINQPSPPGSLEVRGSGFQPNSQVTIRLRNTYGNIADFFITYANSNGNLYFQQALSSGNLCADGTQVGGYYTIIGDAQTSYSDTNFYAATTVPTSQC